MSPHVIYQYIIYERKVIDMANLLVDFTKGFASSIAPQSLSDLKSEAEDIYSSVIGGAKTAQEKYREISRSPMFRKVSNFFTRRGDEFAEGSSLEDNDDEFDAGFNFGSDDEEKEQTKLLDSDSMKSIARGQVSSMYQIAGKQVEASAMNASEIITTINTRSSEILSSLGGINSSLQKIGEKLDQIIKLTTVNAQSQDGRRKQLYGSDGNLTLGSTFEYLKENLPYQAEFELLKTGASMLPMIFSTSESKAEGFGSLAGMMTGLIEDKRFGILGDRSINDIRSAIDERVSNAQNELLTKLLDWDKFKGLFGDLTRRESNKDYSSSIENQYTRDKAVFDNMTRKTIVDIIPGYLRRITAALTGENLYVSSEGSLTTQRESGFKNVFNSTITSGFNDKRMQAIYNNASDDIDRNDIFMAQRVLVSLYVFRELQTTGTRTKASLFEDGGDPETNKRAVELLASKGGKSKAYWTKVIELITAQLITDRASRSKFAQTIRQTAESSDKRAERYASEATITYDIKAIDDDMVNDVVGGYIERASGKDERTWNERVKAGEIKRSEIPIGVDPDSRASDEALKAAQRERIRQSEAIGNIGKSFREINVTTIDYLGSIFDILNRGINVFAVSEGPFPKMDLKSATGKTSESQKTRYIASRKWSVKNITSSGYDTDESGGNTTDVGETHVETPQEQKERNSMPSITPMQSNESSSPGQIIDGDKMQQQSQQNTSVSWSELGSKIKDWVTNPFEKMKTNVTADLHTIKDVASNKISTDYNDAMVKHQLSKMGDSEDDKHDKAIADAVLAAMNAAAADGDTKEDIGPLMSQISEIKDPKLKSRLTKVVEGTLQRSENTKPAQSKIGKILTWGFGLIKGFVLPTLSKAKTFITTWGKKLLSPILKSLKQSGQRIIRGTGALKEGLFGSKDKGEKGVLGYAKDKINDMKQRNDEKRLKRLEASLVEINEKPKKDQQQQSQQQQSQQQTDEKKKDNVITRTTDKIKDKMKQSEFGQGFLSASEKKKDINNMKPETLADQMSKSIHDILKSKDGNGSVFSTIITKITSIGDVFKEGINEITKKKETPDAQGAASTSTSTMPDAPLPSSASSSGSKQTSAEMPSIETAPAQTQSMPGIETPSATAGGATGGATATAAAGATAQKGLSFSLGKMLGGITGILGGLLQAVLTVVMSMAGFKKIMNLVMNVLKNSLKPLNKAFNSIYKAIKPVMKTVQTVLKQLVEYIVQIVESVITIIQPILEAIGPLLEQLMTVLQPILEMVTGLVNVLMVPLVALMQTVVVPVVQSIGNTLEIILGILQVGMGTILTALGGLLIIVGAIGKIFGAGSLFDTGAQMAEMGTNMITSGANSVVSGFKKQVSLVGDMFSMNKETEEPKPEAEITRRERTVDALNGSPMDGIVGSGDYSSIYGGAGANQNRFGNFMNMGERGCGPVALADAYARRSGSSVNARGLTSAMASSGAYNPSMGTSVSGFMSASSSMGMNLHAGGVTPASLKQASPHNPITIIGSGSDFTTRRGNNHYMNVIGTSGGTAYVSNPMNGRVERRSVTSLAANSVMGLYGSGDAVPPVSALTNTYGSGDAGFQFSDGVQEALTNLKEIVQNIINLFTGDDSIDANLKKENDKQALEKAKVDLGGLSDEEKQKLEAEGFELFKKEVPRFEKETDAEYQKRFKSDKYYNHYMAKAATKRVEDETKKSAGSEEGTAGYLINQTLGEIDPETGKRKGGFTSDFMSSMQSYDDSVEQGSFFNQLQEMVGDGYWEDVEGESGFYSDNGARLYTDEYEPSVFDNEDAVNWRTNKGYWVDIPMHEWFQNTMPGVNGMSSAYKRYGPPANDQVEGLAGAEHTGTDFFGPSGTPIRATTDGVVTAVGTDGGAGNFINIEDIGGDIHQYFHLLEVPTLQVGDEVYGGDEIGLMGSTGHSTGPHLHYQIKDPNTNTLYNPFTFFKWHEGSNGGAPYGRIEYEGQLEQGDTWNAYKDRTGVSKFMKTAFEAGLTGPEVATITSTGIWEDGGEKLWGTKSLLNTTYDSNGQAAKGIMNWVDQNVDYGDTVEDQLKYIQRVYFDEDSTDTRATMYKTGYESQDLAGYKEATGRDGWELNFGDHYGPYMNTEDLIEGSEHFFRGALVPACIHTAEGPRKYIGTAVGVYNWLLDEGYISEDDGMSRVWRSYADDDWYPEDYNDDSGYVDIGATAAGNTASAGAATSGDKKSGIPKQWSSTKTGSRGWAKNAAGEKLFEYWVIAGQDAIDRNAGFTNKRKIVANMNGTFRDIWVNINSFPATTAGNNARKFVNDGGTYVESGSRLSADGSGTSSGNTSGNKNSDSKDALMKRAAQGLGLNWTIGKKDGQTTYDGWIDPKYNLTQYHHTRDWADKFWKARGFKNASNWPDSTMGTKFSSAIYKQGTGLSEGGEVVRKNKSMLKHFDDRGLSFWKNLKMYPDTQRYMEEAGLPMSQTYWYQKAGETYDRYYKNINTPYSSSGTFSEYPFKTWGGGDASIEDVIPTTIIPGDINQFMNQGLTDMFTALPTDQQTTAPVIVNKYDIPQQDTDVIEALMTNTYNVRSVQIERMLTNMLTLMRERNQQRKQRTTTGRTGKSSKKDAIFPEQGIPKQVERLSVG